MTNTRPALIALTAALALGVTACGSSDDSGSKNGTSSASASAKGEGGDSTKSSSDGASSDGSDASASASGSGEGDDKDSSDDKDAAGGKDLKAVTAAIDAVEKKTGGTVYEVDDEDGDGTWEVDVEKGSKTIDAEVTKDGKVSVDDEQDDLDDSSDRDGLKAAKISVVDAVGAALKETDGTLEEAELDEEGGKHFWRVTVGTTSGDDREVHVDVVTGKVLPSDGNSDDDS